MAYDVEYVHSGTAVDTTLASDCTNASTTISLTSASGWPSPTGSQKAVGTIKPDTSTEAKFTYTGKSGNDLTGVTWNFDGTTAAANYTAGVEIRHSWAATEANEANYVVRETVGKITAAESLLVSDGANSLTELAVAASRFVGRKALGSVAAMTVAEAKTLLALSTADLSDFDLTGIAAGSVLYWNGTDLVDLPIGSATNVLTVNAGATAPEWAAVSSGTSGVGVSNVATSESTSSATLGNLATVQAITLTTGTKVRIDFWALAVCAGTVTQAEMNFVVSGATTRAAQAGESSYVVLPVAGNRSLVGRSLVVTGLTAGSNTFTLQFGAPSAATVSFLYRTFSVEDLGS